MCRPRSPPKPNVRRSPKNSRNGYSTIPPAPTSLLPNTTAASTHCAHHATTDPNCAYPACRITSPRTSTSATPSPASSPNPPRCSTTSSGPARPEPCSWPRWSCVDSASCANRGSSCPTTSSSKSAANRASGIRPRKCFSGQRPPPPKGDAASSPNPQPANGTWSSCRNRRSPPSASTTPPESTTSKSNSDHQRWTWPGSARVGPSRPPTAPTGSARSPNGCGGGIRSPPTR